MTDPALAPPAAAPADAPRPVPRRERIDALDAMRGLAILGVLVAYTVWNLGGPPAELWGSDDRFVARLANLFVDGKFLTMFACLFGLGVAQQWRRWEAAGADPVALHVRRMGFLLAAGLLHALLLRNGDILAPYALLGFALLAFRRASTRTIVLAAVGCALARYGFQAGAAAAHLAWPARPGQVAGGYWAENLAWLVYWYVTNPFLGWPIVLGLMLAGVLLGRARAIERLAADRRLALTVLAWAVPAAVTLRVAHDAVAVRAAASPAPPAAALDAANLLFEASCWAMAAVYAAGLCLLVQWEPARQALWPLRAVGRMAFTNYLSQAVIVVPLCLAFGMFDHVDPARGLELALAIGIAQLLWSPWWLERHAMGPLERLWRGFTYGTPPAAQPAAAEAEAEGA